MWTQSRFETTLQNEQKEESKTVVCCHYLSYKWLNSTLNQSNIVYSHTNFNCFTLCIPKSIESRKKNYYEENSRTLSMNRLVDQFKHWFAPTSTNWFVDVYDLVFWCVNKVAAEHCSVSSVSRTFIEHNKHITPLCLCQGSHTFSVQRRICWRINILNRTSPNQFVLIRTNQRLVPFTWTDSFTHL